jgi:hypothetical protein
MANEVTAAHLNDAVVKDRHLHPAADIARSKLVQKALAAFPQDLFDLRVWDALDQHLPSDGNVESGLLAVTYYWDPNSADDSCFVATGRAWRVVSITARVEVAGTDAGAVTGVVKKAASGTDIAAGTALHTGTINLKGTVDTNQALSLSATPSDLDIPVGTALGVDFSGVLTAARGVVTVLLAPAASGDDLRLVTGTFGTNAPRVKTPDMKAVGSVITRYARLIVMVPDNYDAAEDLQIRLNAGMETTVADVSATIDVEAYELQGDGTLSADLVVTAAQSINSLSLANKDFILNGTNLVPGDRLDVRIAIAVRDNASVTAVLAVLQDVILRCDVRP